MSRAYRRYLCQVCGYIYDEARGDPDGGLPPGTRYEDIPEDWECPDCGVRKADFVLLEASAAPKPAPARSPASLGSADQVVIVGGGMAAWHVAATLRERDAERPITLISHCAGDLYPKPQLSTALARGKTADALVRARASDEAERLKINLLARTRVLVIDSERRRLITPRGGVPYDQLVLALGARQRILPLAGDAAERVFRVNDLASYRGFQRRIGELGSARVVLLGAGLIGCEFADDLSAAGHRVTLLDLAPRPLSRLLPAELSRQLADTFTAKGIALRLGQTVTGVWHQDGALRVALGDGSSLVADVVLSALGLEPETRLARGAGLAVGQGIQVDEFLRTSAPDIYAVGDCSEHGGRVLPYVRPLREQAEALAANLCGEARRYRPRAGTVTVKTPSLPLAVRAPEEPAAGEWVLLARDGAGAALEYRAGDRVLGFALSGPLARQAAQFERRLGFA